MNAKADAIQSSDVYIEYVEDLIDLGMFFYIIFLLKLLIH